MGVVFIYADTCFISDCKIGCSWPIFCRLRSGCPQREIDSIEMPVLSGSGVSGAQWERRWAALVQLWVGCCQDGTWVVCGQIFALPGRITI